MQPVPRTSMSGEQMLVLPFTSVTVSNAVMVVPACAQVNVLGLRVLLAMPQLSVALMVTIAGVTVTGLPAVGVTWMAWQLTTGGVTSVTVTLKVQLLEPHALVAVAVTVVVPAAKVDPDAGA